MDKDIIQILWSALLIVIVTIAPLVKKFKEMQRKELRSASAARPVRQADADTSAPASARDMPVWLRNGDSVFSVFGDLPFVFRNPDAGADVSASA